MAAVFLYGCFQIGFHYFDNIGPFSTQLGLMSLHESVFFIVSSTTFCVLKYTRLAVRVAFTGVCVAFVSFDFWHHMFGYGDAYYEWMASAVGGYTASTVGAPFSSAAAFAFFFIFSLRRAYDADMSSTEYIVLGSVIGTLGGSPLFISLLSAEAMPVDFGQHLHITSGPVCFIIMGTWLWIAGLHAVLASYEKETAVKLLAFYSGCAIFVGAMFALVESSYSSREAAEVQRRFGLAASAISRQSSELARFARSRAFDGEGPDYTLQDDHSSYDRPFLRSDIVEIPRGESPFLSLLGREEKIASQQSSLYGTEDLLSISTTGVLRLAHRTQVNSDLSRWVVFSSNAQALTQFYAGDEFIDRYSIEIIQLNDDSSRSGVLIPISGFPAPLAFRVTAIEGVVAPFRTAAGVFLLVMWIAVYFAMLVGETFLRVRQASANFETVQDSSQAALVVLRTDGTIVRVNPSFCQLFHVTLNECLQRSISDFIPGASKFIGFDRSPESDTGLDALGNQLPIQVSSSAIRYGVEDATLLTILDLSKQTELLVNLSEEKERYRTLLQSTFEGIIGVDDEGRIIYANDSACSMLGYPEEVLIGASSFVQLFGKPDLDASGTLTLVKNPVYQCLIMGRSVAPSPQSICTAGGEELHVILGASPHGSHGSHAADGAVIVFSDATEAAKTEALRIEHTRKLEQVNADLANYANMVAHDLKEPSRSASMFCEMASYDLDEGNIDAAKERLEKIQSAMVRLYSHVDGLLRYFEAEQTELVIGRVDMGKVVEHVVSDLKSKIDETSAVVTISPNIPSVSAAFEPLTRIMQNLIGNSLKYIRPGVAPQILIAGEYLAEGRVSITVTDNGIGIDDEHWESIFKPLCRLHNSETFEGSGMGLAIVNRLLARMGGLARIKSSSSHGTTFEIRLAAASASHEHIKSIAVK